jgi:hypothetical protein
MAPILSIWPFNLKPEKRQEYAAWLKKNEEQIRKSLAAVGATYRGTYLASFGLAPVDGVTLIEYSSFEDFDAWRELDDPKWDELMVEGLKFYDRAGLAVQMYELAPEGFQPVVVRKHKGKRRA